MKRTLTVALVVGAMACGGKDKATTPATGATAQTEHDAHREHGEHHANLPPEMHAFHDLLAPRWHTPRGDERTNATCGAIDQFMAAADAVAKATPPVAANADTWTTGTNALAVAVAQLEAACKAQPEAFEPMFASVHDAFHDLLKQTGP